jgi:hypothetical protein
MGKGIDVVVSAVFAPQVTPAYMFVLLLAGSLYPNLAVLTAAIVASSALPIVSLIAYSKLSKVDYYVSDPKKRGPLFIFAVGSYAAGLLILLYLKAPFIVSALMLSYAVNTSIAGMINRFEKVSIHVWGLSGPAVALFYSYGYPAFAALIALAALVGISRIRLKAHTPLQVILAMLISVPLTVFVVYFMAPVLFSLWPFV